MCLSIEPCKKRNDRGRQKPVKKAENLRGACFQKPLECGFHWAWSRRDGPKSVRLGSNCSVCLWAFFFARECDMHSANEVIVFAYVYSMHKSRVNLA